MKCEHCNSENIIPVHYGTPVVPPEELEGHGETWWAGGCIVMTGFPTHYCKDCKKEFGKIKEGEDFRNEPVEGLNNPSKETSPLSFVSLENKPLNFHENWNELDDQYDAKKGTVKVTLDEGEE